MKKSPQLLFSSLLTLLVVTGISIGLAYFLGPKDFGVYAAFQSVALVLAPLASLRLETRVAVCASDAEMDELSTAVNSSALMFLLVLAVIVACVGVWVNPLTMFLIVFLAAGMVLADFALAKLAFQGRHSTLAMHRFFRQVLPLSLALLASWVSPHPLFAFAALVGGTWIWALVFVLPKDGSKIWSWVGLKKVLYRYQDGLRASVVLGELNALWLNGLQPLMAWLGLYQVAGQYALLQRLINAPLGVLSVVANTLLLTKGNSLHTSCEQIIRVCIGLTVLASIWVVCLWSVLFLQPYLPVPVQWLPTEDFFYAAAFFCVASFAIGTVSVISIRLHDEWFVAAWQAVFMSIWAVVLGVFHQSLPFVELLYMSGLAYFILLWRWMLKSKYG